MALRSRYAEAVLWVCAAAFLLIGLGFTIAPGAPFVPLGLSIPSGAPMTELRAVYGGMEFAVGVFLVVCARWRGPAIVHGLLLSFLIFMALATFRALGMVFERPQAPIMAALLVAESAGAVFSVSGLLSLRKHRVDG